MYFNIKYNDELILAIRENISLIGIVDSYFKSIEGTFRKETLIEKNQIVNGEIKLKIYPNYKFFYNYCPFHDNGINNYSFYVDDQRKAYYCFGCGFSGNVFDFLCFIYHLDINEAIEILGCIASIFDVSILNRTELKIYHTLMKNYHNKNKLLKESQRKTKFLTERVKHYLELHPLDKEEVNNKDFKKVADRLCCDISFVKKMYYKTDYYQQKLERENQLRLKREKEMIFE